MSQNFTIFYFKKIVILFILLISNIQAEDKSLKILVFQSYHQTLPWVQQVLQGLNDFKKDYKGNIEFYLETIDYVRLKDQMEPLEWEKYLKKKYKNIEFDGILVETVFAVKTFDSFSSQLYQNIPKIYFSNEVSNNLSSEYKNYTVIYEQKEEIIKKTIDLALKHNPKLKNIYVIKSDNGPIELEKELLIALEKRFLHTTIIKDFTIEELKLRLSKLPNDSAVFYGLNFYDKTGKRFVPKSFLKQITPSSSAPIYSFYSAFIGTGTIGGCMIDGEIMIQGVLESLLNSITNDIFINDVKTYKYIVDYNILTKYNIDERNNPKDVIIINKPISIWESYPIETAFAISMIVLLSILLVLTLILKKRGERILKMEESMLVQSKQAEMGEMISVIAHQWRQPLNNISVIVQTILLKYKKNKIDDTIMKSFKVDVLKQINYMSETVNDFRDFYKPTKDKSNFDIKIELEKTAELIEKAYKKKNITIVKETIESFEMVGYANELTHCFLVILNNAKDALVEIAEDMKKVIIINSKVKDDICIISFENNGTKIEDQILSKIFDPYFSTKDQKNGTGIGLYMAKTIIEKHFGGVIEVVNSSKGVKFELKVPKC